MPDLELSADDQIKLAAALAPLIVPFLLRTLAKVGGVVAQEVSFEDILSDDFDPETVVGTVVEHIRSMDEEHFSNIAPLAMGTTTKGTSK